MLYIEKIINLDNVGRIQLMRCEWKVENKLSNTEIYINILWYSRIENEDLYNFSYY